MKVCYAGCVRGIYGKFPRLSLGRYPLAALHLTHEYSAADLTAGVSPLYLTLQLARMAAPRDLLLNFAPPAEATFEHTLKTLRFCLGSVRTERSNSSRCFPLFSSPPTFTELVELSNYHILGLAYLAYPTS